MRSYRQCLRTADKTLYISSLFYISTPDITLGLGLDANVWRDFGAHPVPKLCLLVAKSVHIFPNVKISRRFLLLTIMPELAIVKLYKALSAHARQ